MLVMRRPRNMFNPDRGTVGVYPGAVAVVTLITLGIMLPGVYLGVDNWQDYRFILRASDAPPRRHRWFSLRLNG